jgi:predicted lipoprotein with Yx(FWY)xxD motif
MKTVTLLFLVLAIAALLLIAGCTQQQAQTTAAQATTAPAAVQPADTIRSAGSPLGTLLTDARGMTLYYFANDVPASGVSSCTGACAGIWPVFSAGTITVSSPLAPADFGSIMRADGMSQTTWHGWPLYYYQADKKPGDVYGENVLMTWFVAKPGENVLAAHTPALGLYLTDASGMTLYVFTKDTPGTGTCTGACLAKWPAFNAAAVSAPSVLAPANFSAVSRADGVNQTAWMGRPLYYYAGDMKPGDVNGQGFGNLWYVANVSGMTPVATAVPTPVPTTVPTTASTPVSYGGGGY